MNRQQVLGLMENAKRTLGHHMTFAPSTEACVTGADVIVITTSWQEFKRLEPSWLAENPRCPMLVDCWRLLDPARYKKAADYLALGTSPESNQL